MHPQQRMTLLHLAPMHDATDDRRDDTPGRRSSDGPSVAEHVRAADTVISMGWRWAQILATIIGFGFMAGMYYVQSGDTQAAIGDMRTEFRAVKDEIAEFRKERGPLNTQTALLGQRVDQLEKTNEELTNQLRELRASLSSMRDMREAYVYSAAKSKPTTPP